MDIKWLWFNSGRFDQSCCACGKTIPCGNPREVASNDTNPMPVATIRHPGCRKVILYNSKGVRIRKVA